MQIAQGTQCAHECAHPTRDRTTGVGSGLISSSPSRHPAPRTGASARAVRLSPQVRGFGRLRINTGIGSVVRVYLRFVYLYVAVFESAKCYHSCSSGKFILDLLRISYPCSRPYARGLFLVRLRRPIAYGSVGRPRPGTPPSPCPSPIPCMIPHPIMDQVIRCSTVSPSGILPKV
jgi:hypothetical protein